MLLDSDVATLIKNANTFYNFSTTMQGDFPNGFLGVHTAGHFTIGGDPGGDLFASPGDPMFFLHHSSQCYPRAEALCLLACMHVECEYSDR